MRFLHLLFSVCGGFASIALATEQATLTVQIAVDRMPVNANGPPPNPGGLGPPVNEKLLVNVNNNGVRNAIIYVHTGSRGGTKLTAIPPPINQDRILEVVGGRFEPHILVARVGDTLKASNRDPVGHNANFHFLTNEIPGPTRAPGTQFAHMLKCSEPVPIPVDCNIHPWMRSYLVVLDHPFVGVSDENGNLAIEGLPIGEVNFRFFHEAMYSAKGIMVRGKVEDWPRNLFTLNLKEGVNDLGRIVLPAKCFSPL